MFTRCTIVYSWTVWRRLNSHSLGKCSDSAVWGEPCEHILWGFYEICCKKPFGVKRYYLYFFHSGGSVQSNSTEPSSDLSRKKTCNFSVARLQKRTYGRLLAITCAFLFCPDACSVENPCYLIDNASRSCLCNWEQTWKKRQFLHFNYCPEETVNYNWLLLLSSFKGDWNGIYFSGEPILFSIPLLREYTWHCLRKPCCWMYLFALRKKYMNYLLHQCTAMNLDLEILFFVISFIFEDLFFFWGGA